MSYRTRVSAPITQAEQDLVELIRREGGESWLRLAAKCDYEGMTPIAVIREWGDPRQWPGIPFLAPLSSIAPGHRK